MLCCEHLDPVLNESATCSPDSCKACFEVPKSYGLKYDANQKINLHGYVDSNWAGRGTGRKSTSGFLVQFGILHDLLVQQEAIMCGVEYNRGRVCCCLLG